MATRSVKPLWRVSVSTTSEAEEAVVEMLGRIFNQPASVYSDVETKETIATVFMESVTASDRTALRSGLEGVRACGLNIAPGTISVRKVRREDWAESWKRHFKPLEISSRLLVKPSWSRKQPKRNQALVVLDPGLSFGTGQHPTTGFCLEQLAACRKQTLDQSFLDIGTGSGILAIAAAKLGYRPVTAFDFDPDAVRVARENARQNAVAFNISRKDLAQLPMRSAVKHDVLCANLTYDLLIAHERRITGRLKPGGTLILAGILREQFAAVKQVYERSGMKLLTGRAEREWYSGAFGFRSRG